MHLVRLKAEGFRCLNEIDYTPSPGLNVIRGDNAQGKTSLLEALLFAATSKSHRTTQESDLVQHGQEGFQVRAEVQRSGRDVVLESNYWRGAKRFKVNGVAQTRVSDILGKVNLVFFSPEDVDLVRGAASQRRRFLDMELSQLNPGYLNALQQYRQLLRQRNETLRKPDPDAALLDVWDEQLAAQGEALMKDRAAFVDALGEHAAAAYRQVAEDEPLKVTYKPDIREPGSLAATLKASRRSDLKQAVTSRGPHRDDLEFAIAGRPARHFGSQGQQRSTALALKLAEVELVHERAREYPVLMLDDVLSELDTRRSTRLFEAIPEGVQCLVTTTDLTDRQGLFGEDCSYSCIRSGRLEAEEKA